MTTMHHAPTGTTPSQVRPGAVEDTSVRPSALVSALEAERTAVAGNLHDNVVQGLVAARLALDIAERRGADVELLAPVRSALAGAMREARDTLWSLRSRGADGDVLAAFAALADHLAEHDGPDIEIHDGGLPGTVSHTAGVLAYRVLQVVADESPAGNMSVDVSGTPTGALRLVICAAGLDETPSTRLLRLFNQVSLCGGTVLPVPAGLVVTIPAGEEPA